MQKYTYYVKVTNIVKGDTLQLTITSSGLDWLDAWEKCKPEIICKETFRYEIFEVETEK